MLVKQSATTPLLFRMVDSTDHVTPETGVTPTVTLSKNGAAFGAHGGGSAAELADGWYKYTPVAADTATLGTLLLHATGTGAVGDAEYQVVAFDPGDAAAIGLSRLDANVGSRATPAQVATELGTYDAPTNAEMVARTLAAADYATAANLTLVKAKTDVLTFTGSDVHATLDGEDVDLSSAAATAVSTDLLGTASGGDTVGAKLALIGTGQAILVQAIAAGGRLTLYQGDGYYSADGANRRPTWTEPDTGWPNLTGATVKFKLQTLDITCDVSNPAAATPGKSVAVTLTETNTGDLDIGVNQPYRVVATLASGHVVTLAAEVAEIRTPVPA